MDTAQAEVVRRHLLHILDAARTHDRGAGDDASTYRAEAIIQSQIRKVGIPLLVAEMRGELFYLHDKGLVKFHRQKVGREDYYSWRITAEGVDVVEGNRTVPGIARE